jgi:hypothetical protein
MSSTIFMRKRKKQIKFYVSEEEMAEIEKNARLNHLATGTYLRILGLRGIVLGMDATGRSYEVSFGDLPERRSSQNEDNRKGHRLDRRRVSGE